MAYECKVIADSVSPAGVRLTTLQVTFPRIVLAEFNTHRMFSRNSASSRAIPVEKRIAAVEADPFIPEAFGRNKRGMQATDQLEDFEHEEARDTWCRALEAAVGYAKALADVGVHKQLANRLLEPFCWHTVVVTATEWSNFFALRCSELAQPEIRKPAVMMREAMKESIPVTLDWGQWHLPYVLPADTFNNSPALALDWAYVSAMRCARVSYLTQEGKRDPAEDLRRAKELEANGHMSPFEHPAMADDSLLDDEDGDEPHFLGNFRGWMQARKFLKHEDDYSKRDVAP
jgi:thymidylate synthase ThyX